MLALSEFDLFSKKYLLDWERNSTVRTSKRSRLDKTHISLIEFPLALQPFIEYAEIQALTQEQLHPLYLQFLSDMLYGVAQFEVNFVTDQCGKLANKDLGIELTEAIKQVAIAIGTDEMYHAFAARELLGDIEALTGIIPTALHCSGKEASSHGLAQVKGEDLKVLPLDYFKNAVSPKLERIAETTLLCILENAVVDDLFEMAKNFQSMNPVAVYNKEHIHDEGRHKVFFQRLLRYIWTAISEEDRVVLGEAIGGYFKNYYASLSVDKLTDSFSKQLQKLPLSESVITSIASRAAASELAKPMHEKKFIKNPMHLMNIAGVTGHEPTYTLFLSLGLLSESLETA
jgi:hypothetical protein